MDGERGSIVREDKWWERINGERDSHKEEREVDNLL